MRFELKDFSLKFIDIMVGIVLGLGFQWWPNLVQPWQYLAFIFSYVDIVDYWIDYGPSLKKFPPKREVDVLLDVGITFSLFLYIYTTQLTIIYFFLTFALIRVLDFFWLLSSKREYRPTGQDATYINTWLAFDWWEVVMAIIFIGLVYGLKFNTFWALAAFIVVRIAIRILASVRYKMIHFS